MYPLLPSTLSTVQPDVPHTAFCPLLPSAPSTALHPLAGFLSPLLPSVPSMIYGPHDTQYLFLPYVPSAALCHIYSPLSLLHC
jgi:hypothetical protein